MIRKINRSSRTVEGMLLEALSNFEKRLEDDSYDSWNEHTQQEMMGMYHTIRLQLIPQEYRDFMDAWSVANHTANCGPMNKVVTEIFSRVQEGV